MSFMQSRGKNVACGRLWVARLTEWHSSLFSVLMTLRQLATVQHQQRAHWTHRILLTWHGIATDCSQITTLIYALRSQDIDICHMIWHVAQLWQRDRATVVCSAYVRKVHCAVVSSCYTSGRPCTEHLYVAKLAFFKVGGSLVANISEGRGVAHQPMLVSEI